VAERAAAQAAQVTTDVGPHYVGEPLAVRVTAVGFDEDPPPVVEVAPPAAGRLDFVGVSPSVSQSITIVNGKMSRTREVTHVFQYRFVPHEPGVVKLGPFRIHQGAREARVAVVRLRIQDVPSNEDVKVALGLPDQQVFVGERVPVTVTFTLEQSLQKNALDYTLRVPFFDAQSSFRFLDEAQPDGDTTVVVDTGERQIELRGRSREFSEGGKRYVSVSVTRTLVPLAPGTHRVPGVSFSLEEGVRFRRDFFGGRRATQVRRWRAEAPERELVVAAIPGREQPPSFGGAIGRGFSLDVSADRTVVQVGEPITLSFVVRGEGLETASLPPLDAEGLLPVDRFRVPGDVPTGQLDGEAKRFTAVVRVLDPNVSEIPALAYSWFDPDTKRFETTRSRPIALSVREAEVIGARDVQVADSGAGSGFGSGSGAEGGGLAPDPAAGMPGADRAAAGFALTGADLAIETRPTAVLGARARWGGAWLTPGVYAGSLALLAVAWLDRRRRQRDPAIAQRRRLLDEACVRVGEARSLPPAEAARVIAEALRRMLRELPDAASPDLDALLGECDARAYAPPGAAQSLDDAFLDRAVGQAERLRSAAREGGEGLARTGSGTGGPR
jgi:hypothetical protein